VSRIAGDTRFGTAAAIADAVGGSPKAIVVADGVRGADALSGGVAAAARQGVLLLSAGSSLPPDTAHYLAAHAGVPVFAIGGPAAAAVPSATAVVGADRFATSVAVAKAFFSHPTTASVVNGMAFVDALGAGAFAVKLGGPLLVIGSAPFPGSVGDYLSSVRDSLTSVRTFGGSAVIPAGDLAAINHAVVAAG
jgi:hypothetical protein